MKKYGLSKEEKAGMITGAILVFVLKYAFWLWALHFTCRTWGFESALFLGMVMIMVSVTNCIRSTDK